MEEQKLLKRKSKAELNSSQFVSASTDLAEYYLSHNKFNLALKEYYILSELFKKDGKVINYAQVNRRIGDCYMGLMNFEDALQHYRIYYKTAEEAQDNLEIQRALAQHGHLYLSWYLETISDENKSLLKSASDYFARSLKICHTLTSVPHIEKQDMLCRLFLNLGIIKEYSGEYELALSFLNNSLKISKENDIYEQLYKCYMEMASVFDKQKKHDDAIRNLDLAVEVAKKLKDKKSEYQCAAFLQKSGSLIKLSDLNGAKHVLFKAYKLKTPNVDDKKTIEKNLRIVAAMCYTEDQLITVTDLKERKKLYEKMGDGACDLKNFTKAIEYYKKMLECAEQSGVSGKDLATCYYSLAETFKDNLQYNEAIEYFYKELNIVKDSLKDSLNTLSKIADTKELSKCTVSEVQAVYDTAINLCEEANNDKEKYRMFLRYNEYLRRVGAHTEAYKVEQNLLGLKEKASLEDSSSSENESEDSESKANIGDEIDLSNLTDLSDNSDCDLPPPIENVGKRKRNRTTQMFKKNNKGETPLHIACIKGQIKVVQHLIDRGHPINVRDNAGWLPLHEAVNNGHIEIVNLLLNNGAWINDRGGSTCNGITPLHDSASAGQLEIMDLLLKRGASALGRTNSGTTVLQELEAWYNRTQLPLRIEEQELYDKLVKKLSEILEKAGQTALKSPDKENISITQSKPSPKNKISPKLGFLRRTTDYNEDSDFEDSASDYREVMQSLKNRPTVQKKSPKINVVKSAFVDDELSFDNWLEDDMPSKSKKRKVSSYSPVTTTHEETLSIPDTFSADEFEDMPRFEEVDTIAKKKTQVSLLDAGFSRTRSITPPTKSIRRTSSCESFKSHSQQKKLTSFGHTRNIVEADSTSNSVVETSQSLSQVVNISADPTLFVDVKIEGKVFRVPVLLSQVPTRNVRWLADEAAIRYASKEFMKPTLELETTSGAMLADDDFLNILFPMGATQADQVIGKVIKWSLPPLVERYKEACNHMNIEHEDSLCQIIEEMSINLDLSNRGKTSNKLVPLLKALNHQNTISEIDLSGNFLNTNAISTFCASLSTLHNLNSLNLSCTGLRSSHISLIASVFNNSEQNMLHKLSKFDISHNFLTNSCLTDLSSICSKLKLTDLNLSNTELSENLPDTIHFNLDNLEVLDVSNNKLNNRDIVKFVSACDLGKLLVLNLAKNKSENVLKLMLETFHRDMILEELNLSRCQIEDSEIYKLLGLLANLKKIDLSYNLGLTSISLRRLLEYDSLLELKLVGCDNIFKYFEYAEGWMVNFGKSNSDKRIFTISFDCESNRGNCEIVEQLFKNQFVECIVNKYLGFLSVTVLN